MGRVLTLVDGSYEQQTLTVQPARRPGRPLIPVTVPGRPAHMVLLDAGYQRIWFLTSGTGRLVGPVLRGRSTGSIPGSGSLSRRAGMCARCWCRSPG